MIKLLKTFLFFSVVISIIASCSDDPNSVGSDLVPNSDVMDILTINSEEGAFEQQSKYYSDSLNLTSSSMMLLGKHDNVESTMLMKFLIFLPDSIKDAVTNGTLQILSSKIELFPIYTFADKSNYFDFSVNKINSSWNSLAFTKESLADLDYEDIDRSSNRVYEDTLITLNFDKELTQEWLEFSAADDQADNNKGLYFNYAAGSDKVVGFPAISYGNDDKLARLQIIVEVPDSFIDTIVVQVTSDVHVVLGDLPTGSADNMFVQGGITVRSSLMFDLSIIPDNTIINSAILTLAYDESESLIGTKTSDSLGVASLKDYATNIIDDQFPPALLRRDSLNYSGDITRFVQSWVSNNINNGLQIYLVNEVTTVNKVALKGSTVSDPNLKPYLKIIYTSKR